jgi:hypothetical protein
LNMQHCKPCKLQDDVQVCRHIVCGHVVW